MNYLIEIEKKYKKGLHWYSLYKCKCGVKKIIRRSHVLQGRTVSCGCYNKSNKLKHGMWGTDTYHRWEDMKQRVSPDAKRADRYYDRGINVCKEWQAFDKFYEDMGDCNGLELDRKNNDKGYFKDNCRWTTRTIQMRNTGITPHSSQYRGISFHKQRKKWRANISINKQHLYLGSFDSENEAAIAWNAEAKKHEGFNLNIIDIW